MSEADLLDLAASIIETRDELAALVTRLQSGEGRTGRHG